MLASFTSSIPPYQCLICNERMDSIQIDQNQVRVYRHSIKFQIICLKISLEISCYTTIKSNKQIQLTSALLGADAEPSKWLYNWLSTSRSLFILFLFGWIKIAWKLTGKPYLSREKSILIKLFFYKKSLVCLLFMDLTYLSTDSTNTRRALTWIHAQNVSLKFTFNHRTSGP